MGKVVILGKQQVSLHTKSPKNSPNKESISIEEDRIARYYSEYGICIVKPVIDRLVITYDLQDFTDSQKEELKECIKVSLIQDAIHSPEYKSVDYHHKGKAQYKSYHINVRLIHEPTGQGILIQADPTDSKKPYFRFDLSPALLGKEGIDYFKAKLADDFSLPDAQLSFDLIAKQPKSIKRMDIAVDILGADVGDMFIRYCVGGNPVPKKSHSYVSGTGRAQTKYLNAKSGVPSNTYVYNKKEALNEKDQKSLFPNVLYSRFEQRVEKTTHSLYDIHKLKNHLKKADIKAIDYASFADKDFTHILFMQYVRDRGLEKTLKIIPEDKQQKYIDTYNKGMVDIWYPEEFWGYWPETVKNSGLINTE